MNARLSLFAGEEARREWLLPVFVVIGYSPRPRKLVRGSHSTRLRPNITSIGKSGVFCTLIGGMFWG